VCVWVCVCPGLPGTREGLQDVPAVTAITQAPLLCDSFKHDTGPHLKLSRSVRPLHTFHVKDCNLLSELLVGSMPVGCHNVSRASCLRLRQVLHGTLHTATNRAAAAATLPMAVTGGIWQGLHAFGLLYSIDAVTALEACILTREHVTMHHRRSGRKLGRELP
jgi:hypothetical protein